MKVKIIECPRDAMQGILKFINTDSKVKYLNVLLEVGFDSLDCGSFVNPAIIPQMADTVQVLKRLKMTETKLSVIVASVKGAQEAVKFDEITYLGYPFSISETFQKRNTNKTREESIPIVEAIIELCQIHNKKFITYLPMSFGNPYNDPWNEEIVTDWIEKLKKLGAQYFSLSDTVGISKPLTINSVISQIRGEFPKLNFGCHFHTRPNEWREKIETAYKAGCFRFDGALQGYGGCPMAEDELVGNMPTENMINYFEGQGIKLGLNMDKFNEAMGLAKEIFN